MIIRHRPDQDGTHCTRCREAWPCEMAVLTAAVMRKVRSERATSLGQRGRRKKETNRG